MTPHSHQWTDLLDKISKATESLNETIEYLDLISVFRTLHQNKDKPEYTFFSGAHGTLSRVYHTLGHKT